jgi:hypothetical protein
MKKRKCSCGKTINNLKRKCLINPRACCDCNNNTVGCYKNPMLRHDFKCALEWRVEHLFDKIGDIPETTAAAWGFTVITLKQQWRSIPTISLEEKQKEIKEMR